MEILIGFQPLFTAGIFLLAFLSLLGVVFNLLLNPVKGEIQVLKDSTKEQIQDLRISTKEQIQDLKDSHKSLNEKLDQLLAAKK